MRGLAAQVHIPVSEPWVGPLSQICVDAFLYVNFPSLSSINLFEKLLRCIMGERNPLKNQLSIESQMSCET